MASLAAGASFATQLFPRVGATGTTLLRVGFASLLLLIFWRPWRVRWERRELGGVLLFGLALGGMNLCFYLSLRTVPLGVAIAIELLGPLAVAVTHSHRSRDFIWIAVAAAGIALLLPMGDFARSLDPRGLGFALAAGALWAAYIVLGKRVARRNPGPALALGLSVGTLLALPFGVMTAGSHLLTPAMLGAGLALALLSSALPYSLEMFALRRLPTQTFGVLLSLEPVLGAMSGWLFLHQRLGAIQWLAILCVVAASVGVAASGMPGEEPPPVGPEPP
ncbi:EamA family transporter [Xylophilus rhododendri]|uniref:EamA family transporter n=2 Tax=Xylophilus rhododendri TaxID=2697032 RepID=A0A857JF17_9BURK|nr:EamA family transporter [Xylophilus rhododendri]